ncbi:MAG: rRNA (cytosine1962-C5)-methyltransferase [Thermodesulfobacteriota bacterium]|nr:rRNA (cytosine1962-C5)-methyltransferase [Thermodesulfobacteriota bacterium]
MIRLKKQADRKVRRGGLWIFSNEIHEPQVRDLEVGQTYELRDFAGEFLGIVYANPKSLIAARIISRRKAELDVDFFQQKLSKALESRQPFCKDREAYRIVFGESDFIPGLVVDNYGPHIVVQSSAAGIDNMLDTIVDAIDKLLSPESIIVRNDSSSRNLEGIPSYTEVKKGSNVNLIHFRSGELSFAADLVAGQKTGFFLDQEFNRSVLKRYLSRNCSVLDLYCYSAAWAMHALNAGAGLVTAVDSSNLALEIASENARINNFESRMSLVREDALHFLNGASAQWDLIILDPPAFIKSRSKVREGTQGYIDINRKALTRLTKGGLLVSCSCSSHLGLPDFMDALNIAAYRSGRALRILEVAGQGPDHPSLVSMPETRYLKVVFAQAL